MSDINDQIAALNAEAPQDRAAAKAREADEGAKEEARLEAERKRKRAWQAVAPKLDSAITRLTALLPKGIHLSCSKNTDSYWGGAGETVTIKVYDQQGWANFGVDYSQVLRWGGGPPGSGLGAGEPIGPAGDVSEESLERLLLGQIERIRSEKT